MFRESPRKVPDKINKRKVNFRLALNIPVSNHAYRKALHGAIYILLTIVFLGITVAVFDSNKAFVNASSISGFGVGIYWNQDCTNKTFSADWGTIQPGSNTTLTVYIKNEGSSAASLWLATSNWTPSIASNYMSLNWNYSGQALSAGQVIPIELTLTLSPTISGVTVFSFKTIITATGS